MFGPKSLQESPHLRTRGERTPLHQLISGRNECFLRPEASGKATETVPEESPAPSWNTYSPERAEKGKKRLPEELSSCKKQTRHLRTRQVPRRGGPTAYKLRASRAYLFRPAPTFEYSADRGCACIIGKCELPPERSEKRRPPRKGFLPVVEVLQGSKKKRQPPASAAEQRANNMKRAACRQTAQKKTRITFEPETHFSSYPFGGASGERRRRGPHAGIGIPGHGEAGKRRRETRQTKRSERIFPEPVGYAPVEAQQPKRDILSAAAASEKLARGAKSERVHREVPARQVRFKGTPRRRR